jgi:hypothetical protein
MILFERHIKGKASIWNDNWISCQCSYCTDSYNHRKLHYGLNIPDDWKSWNSWWVIKILPYKYIRWTNSWLKKFI